MRQSSSDDLRRFSREEAMSVACIVLLYFLLIDHFRTFSVDDTWFASFSYNFWNKGIVTDTLYQRRFPHGMGGVEAFGKMAAFVQAPLMNAMGLTLRGLEVLSTCFVAASLALLTDICRRLGHSSHFTLCVIAIAGLAEPFVVASQGTRFEFLTLFLLLLGMWCAVRGWVFPAALIVCLSVEVEPAAITAVVGVFVVLLMTPASRRERLRRVPWMLLASACAACFYFALHPNAITVFRQADWSSVDASAGTHGFVFQYLFASRRHYVELVVLLGAIVVSVRSRRYVLKQWPAIAVAAMVVGSVLLKWGNPRYFVLLMPFFALFVTAAFFEERRWKLIVGAAMAIMLPQYAYRYYVSVQRAPALTAADQRLVAAAIERVAASEGQRAADARVLGNSNVWFAHPEHFVALDRRVVQPGLAVFTDVIVCFDTKLDPTLREMGSELKCSELEGAPQRVERFTVHGYPVEVAAATGRPIKAPLPEWMELRRKARKASRKN